MGIDSETLSTSRNFSPTVGGFSGTEYLVGSFDHWCRELVSWVQDMQTLIAAVELAKDVASAEATLQGHRERKVWETCLQTLSASTALSLSLSLCAQGEIDAEEDNFKTTSQFGQSLLSSGHFASEEVKTHLQSLAGKRAALLTSWQERQAQFEQCMELQVFTRDTDQVDSWMAKQEVSQDLWNWKL